MADKAENSFSRALFHAIVAGADAGVGGLIGIYEVKKKFVIVNEKSSELTIALILIVNYMTCVFTIMGGKIP